MASESVTTQTRFPAGLYEYIQKESGRLGISQNAFVIILCELGGKAWDCNKRIDFEGFKPFIGSPAV